MRPELLLLWRATTREPTMSVCKYCRDSDPFLCTDNTNLLLSRRFYGIRNSSLPPSM